MGNVWGNAVSEEDEVAAIRHVKKGVLEYRRSLSNRLNADTKEWHKEEARKSFRSAIDKNPQLPEAYFGLAVCEENSLENYQAA